MAAGTALIGSPETVRRQVSGDARRIRIKYVIGVFAFGDLPYARLAKSLRAVRDEVMHGVSLRQEVLSQ
jgi:hypothetical protein